MSCVCCCCRCCCCCLVDKGHADLAHAEQENQTNLNVPRICKSHASMSCRGDELMLSDLLEALLGALFRDQGLAACQRFVRQQIINTTELDPGVRATPSRKSALISFVNTRNLGHISFKTKAIKKTLSNGTVVNTWNTEVPSFSSSALTALKSMASLMLIIFLVLLVVLMILSLMSFRSIIMHESAGD